MVLVGGGATDIRINGTVLTNRIIVAGGGGGAASWSSTIYIGGAGGGLQGVNGTGNGSYGTAYGGTQTAGGTSCVYGSTPNGSLGQGAYSIGGSGGGAGGGGYYGGGAGTLSGGGGGSGYIGSLSSAQTIDGNTTMPNPSGGNQVGQTGNGYARITLL